MKAGDTVLDSVTGEEWLLAYYDEESDEAAWCGWPPGCVRDASSRLTVVESCSDEESLAMLREWASKADDVRVVAARHVLRRRPA